MADSVSKRQDRAPLRPQRHSPRVFAAEVSRVNDLTPHLRRITITATEFADYTTMGLDEYLGLLIPPERRAPLVLPDLSQAREIRTAVASIDTGVRPTLRWYTVRDHRPSAAEIDIDLVLHGDEGPGSRFAAHAHVGDTVGVRECTALYNPPETTEARLLVGDETAMPAIARILENTQNQPEPFVFIETADPRDRLDLPADVTWVNRRGTPGRALASAVRMAPLPEQLDYAWVCGERAGVQSIRRHLVADRAFDKRRITFSGYWRIGHARG